MTNLQQGKCLVEAQGSRKFCCFLRPVRANRIAALFMYIQLQQRRSIKAFCANRSGHSFRLSPPSTLKYVITQFTDPYSSRKQLRSLLPVPQEATTLGRIGRICERADSDQSPHSVPLLAFSIAVGYSMSLAENRLCTLFPSL